MCRSANVPPNGEKLTSWRRVGDDEATTTRRRGDDDTRKTKRTQVQPQTPTINGNPSLRIREKNPSKSLNVQILQLPIFPICEPFFTFNLLNFREKKNNHQTAGGFGCSPPIGIASKTPAAQKRGSQGKRAPQKRHKLPLGNIA